MFNHGDEITLWDKRGNYECRGAIVGRAYTRDGIIYDIQPRKEESMASRICGVPESLIRRVTKPYLAYESKTANEPRRIKDEV